MAAPALEIPDSSLAPGARSPSPLLFIFVLLWPAAGLLCVDRSAWLDTLNAAGLCLLAVTGLLMSRGGGTFARSSAGRLWTLAVFLFAALLLSPAFLRGIPMQLSGAGAASWAALALAFMSALLLFVTTPRRKPGIDDRNALEQFLESPRVRVHLLIFSGLVLTASAQLGSQPLVTVAFEFVLVALALISVRPLLSIAAQPAGAQVMQASAVLALAIGAGAGVLRYQHALQDADALHALLLENKLPEAQAVAKNIEESNAVLKSNPLNVRLETEWAEYLERTGDFWSSFAHWQRVADYKSIPRSEFSPALRVVWKAGDSMSVWRRLVYKGFAAIREPEVTQGVLELGDRPGSDVRAKLAAALLSCELKQSDADCQRRLQAVQAVLPNELSSHMLLERYDGTKRDEKATLLLPPDLLVGREPTFHAVTGMTDTGSIEEQGEASSIVVLNEGKYEMLINARAVPLREQWPIIRVELNGQLVGRTQVITSEEHPIPFTFEVNRTDAYTLRIVFENFSDSLEDGKIARRGLSIGTISFRNQKN